MEKAKTTLHVCMGSACHLSGVNRVLDILQRLIAEYELQDRLELMGSFCLGTCARTIVLKFEDHFFYDVNPRNVREKFLREVVGKMKEMER